MLKPMHDYIVVDPIEVEQSSSIIIPETVEQPTMLGKVLVAPETYRDHEGEHPIEVKRGDVVIYSRGGVNRIKAEDGEFVLLRQADIFCKIVPA